MYYEIKAVEPSKKKKQSRYIQIMKMSGEISLNFPLSTCVSVSCQPVIFGRF